MGKKVHVGLQYIQHVKDYWQPCRNFPKQTLTAIVKPETKQATLIRRTVLLTVLVESRMYAEETLSSVCRGILIAGCSNAIAAHLPSQKVAGFEICPAALPGACSGCLLEIWLWPTACSSGASQSRSKLWDLLYNQQHLQ